jgi:hypothetical protein
VWLYFRFPLSFRDVDELMLARGVEVSYETIRRWGTNFGQAFANPLRRRRPRPGDKWHLDEVFVKINGITHCLCARSTGTATSWTCCNAGVPGERLCARSLDAVGCGDGQARRTGTVEAPHPVVRTPENSALRASNDRVGIRYPNVINRPPRAHNSRGWCHHSQGVWRLATNVDTRARRRGLARRSGIWAGPLPKVSQLSAKR